jgi:hypothetical protein
VRIALKRSLWGLAILLLAGVLAVGWIVYTSDVRIVEQAEATTTVIVSTQDIPPNTKLDPLIEANVFRVIEVPNELVVPGALQTVDQLRGERALRFIYENEQIPLERIGKPCPPMEGSLICID